MGVTEMTDEMAGDQDTAGSPLTELDKPAPFVPKTVTDFIPATPTGRPTNTIQNRPPN